MTKQAPVPKKSDDSVKRAALDFMRAKAAKPTPKNGHATAQPAPSNPIRSVPRFSELTQFKHMKAHVAAGAALGIENPFYRPHDRNAGATTAINGKEYSNFASYDYVSMNQDPRVHAAAIEAINHYGISSSASRLVAGERPVHQELEQKLADFHGVEAAVTMVSGYLTNLTTITCLMGSEDLVLHDELMHNSALAGAQACGATRRSFKHNDLEDLERLLLRLSSKHRRVLVIVESLYSMDGDLANLPELIKLRSRHGFWLMVDEAHSIGVLGATGRGAAEHYGVDPSQVDIWMGTLSKSMAACGGYIAGSADLIGLLKGFAGGFVYSVGMPPAVAAAACKSLDLLKEEPERVTKLRENSKFFQKKLQEAGLDTGFCEGFAVVPVILGDSIKAAILSNAMLDAGINVLPIVFPAVPESSARLRFFINSDHTKEQLAKAAEQTAKSLVLVQERGVDISSINKEDIMNSLRN